jgi:hypothetical protein
MIEAYYLDTFPIRHYRVVTSGNHGRHHNMFGTTGKAFDSRLLNGKKGNKDRAIFFRIVRKTELLTT